jgi:outer membrane protein OmpA-like peptidoglycan-associated protein
MNSHYSRSLIAIAVAAALVAGCASAPKKPAGSEQVRAKLTALQNDPALAAQAPVATKDAELAVNQAEIMQPDLALASYRVYIADRKVDTARAQAETQAAEVRHVALTEQGEKARLDSRTREADLAKSDALTARAENAEQKVVATQARSDADAAQLAANASQQQASELQRQLEIMQAKPTDRGLVLTLGDTLFATGKSEIKSGATANLDRLGDFLAEYPDRTASIEGFTDSTGSEDSNQVLSEHRADSVKRYLVGRGVQSARLTSTGRGESAPVADNESLAGRQQNRRVEVVISEAAGSAKIGK